MSGVLRSALSIALAGALVACGADEEPASEPPPLTVMTFNVLCSICGAADYDPWDQRLGYFGDIFARHAPDLIGIQELTPIAGEVDAVLAQAPGHAAIYYAPEDRPPYPDAAILYRRDRFSVLEHGEYWLSPTPDQPSSIGFSEPQLPRLLVWARLRDEAAGRELYVASTHFDNNSPSQELSAPLVLERTAPYVEQGPVIVVGDFNSKPASDAYQTLTTDSSHGFVLTNAFDLAADWRVVSNQTPAPDYDVSQRIDHVFLAGDGITWSVEDWAADLSVYGDHQRYPSDHRPIVARVAAP